MFKSMLALCVVMWLRGVATVFAAEPPTDPWELDRIFGLLLEATDALSHTEYGKSSQVAENLGEISWSAEYLSKIVRRFEAFGPEAEAKKREYLIGLTIDAWEMKNVTTDVKGNGPPDPERWSGQISDVRADLRSKLEFSSNPTFILLRDFGRQGVAVHITTRARDGAEVQNCEVWFVLKGLINYKDRFDHFDQPSSPTSRWLPPGNYVIWTRKDSVDGPLVSLKDLGIDRQPSRDISIPAP